MAGVRSSKTVGSTTYNYTTLSGLVTRQTWGSNSIDFLYDENNQPFAMKYNGTWYYYVLNVQGDVVKLIKADGTAVASYTYDPWGKILTSTGDLANINPLRYRGYYYDTETGLYYLQSRYYDPEIGRFINADAYATTDVVGILSANMYAYCENDPVNYIDSDGHMGVIALSLLFGAMIAMALVCAMPDTQRAFSSAGQAFAEAYYDAEEKLRERIDALNQSHPKSYSVYMLTNSEGRVEYVGRTTNMDTRMNQHRRNPKTKVLQLGEHIDGLTYCQARILEQTLMISYATLNVARDTSYFGKNYINGISRHNGNLPAYIQAFEDYVFNQVSNEYYCLLEIHG